MASAMSVFRKFRSSDGRIKIVTLSGVSVLVAVIAMLVGVLPVMADHDGEQPLVEPHLVQYGGGSGACDFVEVDSDADNELHDNNPSTRTLTGADGTEIAIAVTGETFSFEVLTPGMAVYDVVVNGGPHNNHYDYDDDWGEPVTHDAGLHAPTKNNGDLNNLSHINICYDFQPTLFQCGQAVDAVRFGDQGEFTGATTTVLTIGELSVGDENCSKLGFFFIEGGETTLDFGAGEGTVTGRTDFSKQFDSESDIESLKYDGRTSGTFEEVPWCTIGATDAGAFDELVSGYPELPGEGHTACKVFESVNAEWTQHTVVYFEFEDPQFR